MKFTLSFIPSILAVEAAPGAVSEEAVLSEVSEEAVSSRARSTLPVWVAWTAQVNVASYSFFTSTEMISYCEILF